MKRKRRNTYPGESTTEINKAHFTPGLEITALLLFATLKLANDR